MKLIPIAVFAIVVSLVFADGDQDTKCGPLLMLGSGLGLLFAN